jgi:hypothetical protein
MKTYSMPEMKFLKADLIEGIFNWIIEVSQIIIN